MRVLVLTLDALDGVGGIQRFNARLLRALAELSDDGPVQDVISLSLWDGAGAEPPEGVTHRGFGRRKGPFVAGLGRVLTGARPDVVIWGHVLLIRLLPMAKALRPGAIHALVVHGVEVWGDPQLRRIPWWEPSIVRRVDRVISVSRVTADLMGRAYRMPADRFALLPNAVDLSDDPGPPERGDPGPLRILTVTRLSSKDTYKGVDVVLRALPEVARERPVVWTVVGDGELRPRYQDLARSLGVDDAVRFVGRVSDGELERWYRWADAFVLPSTGEGFGIVYLEAWAHRLPVVAAAAGGAAEVVQDGETGLLVEPGSPGSVAEALLRLAREPQLRLRLGAAGRTRVEEHYTHDRFRDRLAGILASLGGR